VVHDCIQQVGELWQTRESIISICFLRDRAQRLGIQFWCPDWEGDQIFDLADQDLRADSPSGLDKIYTQSGEAGYTESALHIQDNTDIEGYFQSNKYYADESAVKQWFSFKYEVKFSALENILMLIFLRL